MNKSGRMKPVKRKRGRGLITLSRKAIDAIKHSYNCMGHGWAIARSKFSEKTNQISCKKTKSRITAVKRTKYIYRGRNKSGDVNRGKSKLLLIYSSNSKSCGFLGFYKFLLLDGTSDITLITNV